MRAPTPRETRALKATLEPMLMSDSKLQMTQVLMIELNGMSQPGRTYTMMLACQNKQKVVKMGYPIADM